MDLDSDLPPRARSLGADYYGVADLGSAQEFIRMQGGDRVARYPRAVVVGIRLLDTLVDRVEDRNDRTGASLYRHFGYDVVNAAMDAIALQVANTIQQKGYRALPIPASKRASDGARSRGSSRRNWQRTWPASAGLERTACLSPPIMARG